MKLEIAIATGVVWIAVVYLAVGVLIAAYFVTRGAGRIDPNAQHGTWGFRLLIFPGAAALWPVLLRRIVLGMGEPPVETNAHRKKASRMEHTEQ